MRRLLFWLVLVPLGALIILFAVANREPVVLSLDPFSGGSSALSFSAPLFVVVLGSTIVGVAIGGIASLLHRFRMWRSVRQAEQETARYKAEAENERLVRESMQPEYPPLGPPP